MKDKQIALKLQKIVNILLLNGTLVDCPGLIHGKMGIAVFFFHYAQYTDNGLFEDYAMEAINEMRNQIHISSPVDYERGIAGIGVGINYLIKNNFLSVDNDFFDDFDQRMYRAVMYDPCPNYSLYDGLAGYGRYWIYRMNGSKSNRYAQDALKHILKLIEEKPWNMEKERSDIFCFLCDLRKISQFTDDLENIETQSSTDNSFFRLGNSTVGNFVRTYLCRKHETGNIEQGKLQLFDMNIKDSIDMNIKDRMGLLNGYAGYGLCLLGQVDNPVNSWIDLM